MQGDAIVQVTHAGVNIGSQTELDAAGALFERCHCVLLPRFVEARLFRTLQRDIEHAAFQPSADTFYTYHFLEETALQNRLLFVLNTPRLFRALEAITACPHLGSFQGSVYRLMPGSRHRLEWHNDVGDDRVLALSVNFSTGIYAGGLLQIREAGSEQILHEAANTTPGDALVFRVAPHLQHRVTGLEGCVPKTALAGWFRSRPDSAELMRATFQQETRRVTKLECGRPNGKGRRLSPRRGAAQLPRATGVIRPVLTSQPSGSIADLEGGSTHCGCGGPFPRLPPLCRCGRELLDAAAALYIYCPCTYPGGDAMPAAIERIVVQATPEEKKAIVAKARRLGLPISELMRRGARVYESAGADQALGALADAAKAGEGP